MRFVLVLLASFLALAGTAHAQGVLDRAADTLRLDPVFVDPDAERAISDDEAESLREAIPREDAGPLYLAVLPADAASEAGGDHDAALRELARAVGEPGTYAAVIGDSLRVRIWAWGWVWPRLMLWEIPGRIETIPWLSRPRMVANMMARVQSATSESDRPSRWKTVSHSRWARSAGITGTIRSPLVESIGPTLWPESADIVPDPPICETSGQFLRLS